MKSIIFANMQNSVNPLLILTILVLAVLLLWVSFTYSKETTKHFTHAAEGMMKMLLTMLVVILILDLLIYSWLKLS